MRRTMLAVLLALLLIATLALPAFAQDQATSITQSATNSSSITQGVAAVSGDALAAGSGTASSGNAMALAAALAAQINLQVAVNSSNFNFSF